MLRRATAATLALAALGAADPASGQVDVTLRWTYPVETVYASDVSPYNVGQQPDFLSITVLNGAAGPQTISLELEISQVEPVSARVFRGRTDPFVLEDGARRLSNRDLASRGRDVSVVSYEIGARAEELTDRIAETGRFPAGAYRFTVRIRGPDGDLLAQDRIRRELINATRVELVGPGAPFGQPPPVVSSPSPRFVWSPDAGVSSEAGSEGEYELRVVPVDEAVSAEGAMQGFAAWTTTTRSTSAVYPGSAEALRLEPGTTYAWQVTRRIRTSGGTERLESPIYVFRMAESGLGRADAGSGGTVGADQSLGELGRALGLEADLEDFEPTGQVLVDGEPVSADRLEELVRAVLAGEVSVSSVRLR